MFDPLYYLSEFPEMRRILNKEGREGLYRKFGLSVSEYCQVLDLTYKVHPGMRNMAKAYSQKDRLRLLVIHNLTMDEAEHIILSYLHKQDTI